MPVVSLSDTCVLPLTAKGIQGYCPRPLKAASPHLVPAPRASRNVVGVMRQEGTQVAIRNPAVREHHGRAWGDEYFGRALAQGLSARGCTVRHQFWPEWSDSDDDAVIVLRGLRPGVPSTDAFSVLWIISHPMDVTAAEMDRFDLVLTASPFHSEGLRRMTRAPVRVARQCTDQHLFTPPAHSIDEQVTRRSGTLYVARSRNVRRDMAQWLQETQLSARIIGNGWDRFGLSPLVTDEHVQNEDLPAVYRRARLCLNDHWSDMRALGYVNNRVLDSLACGLPVVSDDFPELREEFGDALFYANEAKELRAAVEECEQDYGNVLLRCQQRWREIGERFSFDNRAEEILEWILNPPTSVSDAPVESNGLDPRAEQVIRSCIHHEVQRVDFLEREIGRYQGELASAREREHAMRSEFETRIGQYQADLEQARKDEHAARVDAEKLQSQLEKAADARERLETELNAMKASRTWRVTRPIRILGRHVRSLLALRPKSAGKTDARASGRTS